MEKCEHAIKTKLELKKIGLQDVSIYLNPKDEGLSNQLLTYGIREPLNSYFLVKRINLTNPSVLDIGGNIGYFPIIEALSKAKEVEVYEPVTENFGFLIKNTAPFTNVNCYNLAIGETKGINKIFITNRRNNSSMEPCKEYMNQHFIRITKTQKVKTITLSDACDKFLTNNVLCRMDVEGYESKILNNIPENIKEVSFELHTRILGKKQSITLIEKLENDGFKIILMTRELEGMMNLFKIFGFKIFRIYNRLKEKRIYINPKKSEIIKVIGYMQENPHIFALR